MIVRSLGWGIMVYAIMYLAWSGLVIYGFSLGILSLFARLAVLAIITGIAVSSLRLMDWKDVVPHASIWAIVAILLDGLYLVPFTGWGLYASWSVWFGYMLVILIPVVIVRVRTQKTFSRLRIV